MRICFIGDADSVHMQRWVRWFAAEHEVGVISGAANGLAEHLIASLPTTSPPGTRLLRSAYLARRAVTGFRPDVLHCHYINESGWLGASTLFHPLVITAWGSDVYRAPAESALARRLNPWAARSADWVTCDSEDQASVIRDWGVEPARLSVIGWGVDRRAFHPGVDGTPIRERLGIPAASPVLLSPRQWIANSNIPAIIAAHAELGDDVFLILKRLPTREHGRGGPVEDALAATPARGRIRVLDEVSDDELPALYGAADVVISICTTDGTPVSVLEAMAVGRPVVAFANASLAEWVEEPGGMLVEALAPRTIADAIRRFLEDPEARTRAAAHNVGVVAARADRASELGRMDSIYSQLAGGR